MTKQELTQLEELIEKLHSQYLNAFAVGKYVIQPIYWSEDNDGNINYDVESMRDEFNVICSDLEEHNENSDFDWDSIQ
jgi:hypothetical protein